MTFWSPQADTAGQEPEIALALARTYQRIGRIELAEQQVQRALELRPESSEAKELVDHIQQAKPK